MKILYNSCNLVRLYVQNFSISTIRYYSSALEEFFVRIPFANEHLLNSAFLWQSLSERVYVQK